MRGLVPISLVGLLSLLACERAHPILICHNANCVEPADPEADDTIESLRASLALEWAGRPAIDGVEIDLIWDRAGDRCLFAHDLQRRGLSPTAGFAAEEIGRWLRGRPASDGVTQRAERFHVFIELKPHVTAHKRDEHTAEERRLHAECGLRVRDKLAGFAQASAHPMQITFTSFAPALLRALRTHPSWSPSRNEGAAIVRLGALFGIPKPLDGQSQPVADFEPALDISMVSVHPHWLRHGAYHGIKSRGWGLGFWMFSANAETLDAIDTYAPTYVTTSEMRFLRGWLE